jgi:uncharacterized protein (TIGR02271 family)
MAVNYPTSNPQNGNRIMAFFSNQEDAFKAVSDLKDAGFTANEIGLMSKTDGEPGSTSNDVEHGASGRTPIDTSDANTGQNESIWEKLKHLFAGDSAEDVDYRDSSAELNWDQKRRDYYYRGIGQGGALVSVAGERIQEAREILEEAGGDLRESGFENLEDSNSAQHEGVDQDHQIQLRGEVLHTFRERIQRGEVRLRKEVVTENKTIDVPVTREELVIERVPGSGKQVSDTSELGSSQETRIPLTDERVRVEKQPVVTEEVRVGKRRVQKTETVSEKVRHEELRVEKDGNVDTRDRQDKKPAA